MLNELANKTKESNGEIARPKQAYLIRMMK